MDYVAIIHKEAGSDYGVSFPDFPGCITAGRTLDEAKDMAIEALSGHIADMQASHEAIPAPSSLDAIMADPDFRDGVAFLVGVNAARGSTVRRINITVPEDALREIDQRAQANHLTRSAYLVRQALAVQLSNVEQIDGPVYVRETGVRTQRHSQRDTDAQLIVEVLKAIPSGTARPREIKKALQDDKDVEMPVTLIRHALGRLATRHVVAASDDGKTWSYLGGSA
jgi:predicted RNase H-like HicB family nuclease